MLRGKKNNERPRVSTYIAVGVVGSLLWLSSAVAAPPRLEIDYPLDGTHVSGLFNILGWAVGITAPIDYVEVSFNGERTVPVGYGGERRDVGLAFPDIPDADLSGYALGFNARMLTNGIHQLTARAVDMNGEAASRSIRFLVSNAPGEENPRKVEFDLRSALLEPVGKTEILAQNIEVAGQLVTSVLKYDQSSSQLVAISFVADQDINGIRDDDKDSDGFADNDADRDGFPDDDLNRNALSDSLENINNNTNVNNNTNSNGTNSNTNTNGNSNDNTNSNDNDEEDE